MIRTPHLRQFQHLLTRNQIGLTWLPKSIIAASYSMLNNAIEAAKNGDSSTLSLLVAEGQIVIRGEQIVVMILGQSEDYTEVIIPMLYGSNHKWVRSADLQVNVSEGDMLAVASHYLDDYITEIEGAEVGNEVRASARWNGT